MKKNMGTADRVTRVIIAAIIAILYFTGTVTGVFGIILLVIAGILVATGLVGFCPLYYPLGIRTSPKRK